MEQAAVALEAIGESIVFLDHFKELPDPRQHGKITYPLGEVLLLCLLAVLGGAETFVASSPGWQRTRHRGTTYPSCRIRTHHAPANFTTRRLMCGLPICHND
jgi:hypothetical protein